MHAGQLTTKEEQVLARDRRLVESRLNKTGIVQANDDGALKRLESLLRSAAASPELFVALGTAFGDVLAAELGLRWVMATDQIGSDHALQLGNTMVFVFPRSMLLKRIQRGERPENIDLAFMLGEIARSVNELAVDAAQTEP